MVAHLLLECRKWHRERETLVRKLEAGDIILSQTSNRKDLRILSKDDATVDMLKVVETIRIGKRLGTEIKKINSWDVHRPDRSDKKEEEVTENGTE